MEKIRCHSIRFSTWASFWGQKVSDFGTLWIQHILYHLCTTGSCGYGVWAVWKAACGVVVRGSCRYSSSMSQRPGDSHIWVPRQDSNANSSLVVSEPEGNLSSSAFVLSRPSFNTWIPPTEGRGNLFSSEHQLKCQFYPETPLKHMQEQCLTKYLGTSWFSQINT